MNGITQQRIAVLRQILLQTESNLLNLQEQRIAVKNQISVLESLKEPEEKPDAQQGVIPVQS